MINKYNRMIKFVSIKNKQNHIKRQLYTEYFSAYNCLIFYISLYSLLLFGLHLFSYNTVLVSRAIIRTFPKLPDDEPIHLILIQILGTDIVLIIFVIFIIHTVFAIPDTSKSPPTAYCFSQLKQGTYLIRLNYTIAFTASNIHRKAFLQIYFIISPDHFL